MSNDLVIVTMPECKEPPREGTLEWVLQQLLDDAAPNPGRWTAGRNTFYATLCQAYSVRDAQNAAIDAATAGIKDEKKRNQVRTNVRAKRDDLMAVKRGPGTTPKRGRRQDNPSGSKARRVLGTITGNN
jgi:hypothetical protein